MIWSMRLPQCCQKVVAASGRRTIQLCASIGLPPTPLVTCLLGALDGRNPESLTTGRVVRCLDTQVYHSPVHPSELPRRRLLGRVTRPHLSSVSPPSLSHAHVRRQCFTLREGKDRLTILILGSCSPPLLCGLAPRPLSPHTAQHLRSFSRVKHPEAFLRISQAPRSSPWSACAFARYLCSGLSAG